MKKSIKYFIILIVFTLFAVFMINHNMLKEKEKNELLSQIVYTYYNNMKNKNVDAAAEALFFGDDTSSMRSTFVRFTKQDFEDSPYTNFNISEVKKINRDFYTFNVSIEQDKKVENLKQFLIKKGENWLIVLHPIYLPPDKQEVIGFDGKEGDDILNLTETDILDLE